MSEYAALRKQLISGRHENIDQFLMCVDREFKLVELRHKAELQDALRKQRDACAAIYCMEQDEKEGYFLESVQEAILNARYQEES